MVKEVIIEVWKVRLVIFISSYVNKKVEIKFIMKFCNIFMFILFERELW